MTPMHVGLNQYLYEGCVDCAGSACKCNGSVGAIEPHHFAHGKWVTGPDGARRFQRFTFPEQIAADLKRANDARILRDRLVKGGALLAGAGLLTKLLGLW